MQTDKEERKQRKRNKVKVQKERIQKNRKKLPIDDL